MKHLKRGKRSALGQGSFPFFPQLSFVPPWVLLAFGWALTFLGLAALLDFHLVVKPVGYPQPTVLPPGLVYSLLILGWGAMVLGFRSLPNREVPEPSVWGTWGPLLLILIAGSFIRLYRFDQPPAPFWDDWADGIVWQNIMRDKDRFYWMFPTDGREPFLPYVMMGLMEVLPDTVRDFVIKRFAGCLVDLTAMVLVFLAGRQLGSSRAGLAAAALVAFSRPTLQLTLSGMRAFTLTLAVAFLLYACAKLWRRPMTGPFLLWGFALAFGVHTYSSYRVFMMAVPFLMLVWVLWASRKERPGAWDLGASIGAAFLLLGVYSGTLAATFPFFEAWQGAWDALAARPWGMAVLYLAVSALAVIALRKGRKDGSVPRLGGWSAGLVLACALVHPISRSVGFTERMSGLSPFHQAEGVGNPLVFFWDRAWLTIKAIFYHCPDRNDLAIGFDPFYDLFSQGAVVLGLAFLASRWTWRGGFLLAAGALGTVVYFLSNDHASTKLAASAVPLFLLSGWAVSRIWNAIPAAGSSLGASTARWALAGAFILYAAFGAALQFQKLHGHWAQRGGVHTDTGLAKQVGLYESRYKVYLAPADWFFGWNAQCVLNEGRRYYILKTTNSVLDPVEGGEEDILVLVFGADRTTQEALRRGYPGAKWEKVPLNPYLAAQDPNPELHLYRVFISHASLTGDPSALLFRRKAPGPWLRRYYNPLYGWLRHGILREARVERFAEPIPLEELFSAKFEKFNKGRLLHSQRTFQVEEQGDYEFEFDFQDPFVLRIDGKIRSKMDSPKPGKRIRFKARLDQGDHRMDVKTRFVEVSQLPDLKWRKAGETEWRLL